MKILFIEDEAAARSGLTGLLARRGHIVDFAETCEAAERALRTTRYDLVILDIMLPRSEYEQERGLLADDAGVTLLDNLRGSGISGSKTNPAVPVVALTAVVKTAVHERIHRHRDVHLAVKPIDPEEVLRLIQGPIGEGGAWADNRKDAVTE